MSEEHLRTGVKAALFMDFDNIYSSLFDVSEVAAAKFARDPSQWLSWFKEGEHEALAVESEDVRPRQLLVRRCYLNPVRFGNYRAPFTRSGFSVIDCPPLTSKAKNSADIYMVMDIMDILGHKTKFEEFIILSSDADFTPVLLRLREHDRRSMIISNLVTAAALKAACDFFIELDDFIEDALEVNRTSLVTPVPAKASVPRPRPSTPLSATSQGLPSPAVVPPLSSDPKEAVQEYVRHLLSRSSRPLLFSQVGLRIQKDIGTHIKESRWCGYETLTGLLRAIQPALGFKIAARGTTRAWIYDPTRHQPPELHAEAEVLPGVRRELAEFIDRMNKSIGLPKLAPIVYRRLFETIAEALNQGFKEHFALLGAAERSCYERHIPARRDAINFVLAGLSQGEYDFVSGPHEVSNIAFRFFRNTTDLCSAAQIQLSSEEQAMLEEWLGSNGATTDRNSLAAISIDK